MYKKFHISSSSELLVDGAKCAKFDFGWTFKHTFFTKPVHIVPADIYQGMIDPSGLIYDMS
jgi:hypothetical protein